MANKLLMVFAACLTSSLGYRYDPDMGENYFCASVLCCKDREDSCSVPILGTLCYCDDFCDRNRPNDDCCPDYRKACKGEEPPPGELIKTCLYKGQPYLKNEERMDDCNKCICILDSYTNQTIWSCTQNECIISDSIVSRVNSQRGTWRAARYAQFEGKTLKDGLIYKLGTMPISLYVNSLRYNSDIDFPAIFDARQQWPNFISPIRDQGWCGSDWAIAIASVTSDRFAIQSKGAESMLLSPQRLLSCNVRRQRGCQGGHIDGAWNFIADDGFVDEECFPYKATMTKCPFRRRGTLRDDRCRVSGPQRKERYRVGPVSKLDHERDIMYDIMTSGPVHAIMTVHQDFFHYRDGVYRYSALGENQQYGLHSVRIIGWGEERGQKYWLVANSWGTGWGENGYFKIARGENESGIESFVVSALALVQVSYDRK